MSVKALKANAKAHDGRLSVNLNLDLDHIYNCGGIDGFNDMVDHWVIDYSGHLSDINYKVVGVRNGQVIINVNAELED